MEDGPISIRTVIFNRQDLKPFGLTVTETALAAAAVSLPRIEGRSYQCELPIAAPPGFSDGTVNNLVNVLIDRPSAKGTPSADAFRLRLLLRAEIEAARDTAASARLAMFDGAPAFLVRVIAKNGASAHDTQKQDGVDRFKLTSYQAVLGGADLCGSPPSFALSIPTLRPNDRFTANFVGFGDVVAATFVSRPGPITDSQAFPDRLVNAIADFNAADSQHEPREG